MSLSHRISVLSNLGEILHEIGSPNYTGEFQSYISKASASNAWFTPINIQQALKSIGQWLTRNNLETWLSGYSIPKNFQPKNIGLVLAGNLPLVGFHDILSALILGHSVTIKLSSRDQVLYHLLKDALGKLNRELADRIEFTEGNIGKTDAIIATGSDNSARYFEFYFAGRPHIIRKNRNSLAILNRTETNEELTAIGHDMFAYFGLGCRNVSMILIPRGYNFDALFNSLDKHALIDHNKYANNYDYQKAVLSLNRIPFYDTGFTLFRESEQLASPISVVHYMFYDHPDQVIDYVQSREHKIQCIISKTKWPFTTYEPGMAQYPELWDYADNIDTIDFLLNLN